MLDFFLLGFLSFLAQLVVDRFTITYFYEPMFVLSDPASTLVKLVLAFASCLYLIMGYYAFAYNQCTISKVPSQDILYPNQP